MRKFKWQVGNQTSPESIEEVVRVLLENRNIDDEKLFFDPPHPEDIALADVGISNKEVDLAIGRIKKAIKDKEVIVIYGDYDTDGISATAILWESIHSIYKKVFPHIPDRFDEGYGINEKSVAAIKQKWSDLGLVITVDNGVVAFDAVSEIIANGVDVIISDHHEPKKNYPSCTAVVHTTKISGAGIAWFLAREIKRKLGGENPVPLELAAIGTLSDVLPLTGANRSFVKYGLDELRKTSRVGILALCRDAAVDTGKIGTYEIGYIISPRINAMGRLASGIDSLRLLCTRDPAKAEKLSLLLSKTNKERQDVVESVLTHAKAAGSGGSEGGMVLVADSSYHEGVIGLAASRLVDEYYRPAIVFSVGERYAKASARSIPGFNIIETIRTMEPMLIAGGGHEMAAGFTILTRDFEEFTKELNSLALQKLSDDLLVRRLNIDTELGFKLISWDLLAALVKFEPTGPGNPAALFTTSEVTAIDIKTVGAGGSHLKLKLGKDGAIFDAIGFGLGDYVYSLTPGDKIDIAYNIEENVWNGRRSLQLKLKDIKNDKHQI